VPSADIRSFSTALGGRVKGLSHQILLGVLALAFAPQAISAEESPKKKGVPKAEEKSAMVKRAEGFTITRDYVHRWIKYPSGSGKSLSGGDTTVSGRDGYITVTFFIASWDIKSQELLRAFQKIEAKYRGLSTNFVYVFSHDTFEDAAAFAKDAGIGNGVVAAHELQKNFHHPKIPSVYVGDKDGWLVSRFLDTTPEDLGKLDKFLELATAL
jgi:thiol-disulfide isomerase/thioredoxin